MKRADNHSHIIQAGILDMVASAKHNRIEEISITEHVSQFTELRKSIGFGSVHTSGKMFQSLKEYDQEFEKIDVRTRETIRINRGLEVDYSTRYETQLGEFVNREQWDILLCSVHEFGDGRDIERNPRRTEDTGHKDPWRGYFELQNMALESSFVPFRVLAHPVRMSRGTREVPEDIDDLLLGLAKTARVKSKALELNGNDIDYNSGLVKRLAKACSRAGCSVSLGSDAHYPREVFRNVEATMALAEEFKLHIV